MSDPKSPAADQQTAAPINLDEVKNFIGVLGTLASIALPGAGTIVGFTIPEIANILKGLVDSVPEITAAYNDIKSMIDGGAAPTPEQLLALRGKIDVADDQLQKDAAAKA
ncbi:MAG: hypothetical protein HY243_14985 [Proteobacteria bacterium]|nr:hypothetical protein [Pseudomonadota bacterium]